MIQSSDPVFHLFRARLVRQELSDLLDSHDPGRHVLHDQRQRLGRLLGHVKAQVNAVDALLVGAVPDAPARWNLRRIRNFERPDSRGRTRCTARR